MSLTFTARREILKDEPSARHCHGRLAQAWAEEPIVQEALAQITCYHNLTLLEKVKRPEERLSQAFAQRLDFEHEHDYAFASFGRYFG